MRILITAGPTREYLDDVRYLSNASSGQMGYALATAAVMAGHEVVLVSGPTLLVQPAGCEFHAVETTGEMLDACQQAWPDCDGVIAAAAVCDYRPVQRIQGKLGKTGRGLNLELVETPDILATLGANRGTRWNVGFALEAQDAHARAIKKLHKKQCDVIVLNRPSAIGAADNSVELLDPSGQTVATWSGPKLEIAHSLIAWIETNLAPK